MRSRSAKGLAALVVATALVFGGAAGAFAADERSGYRECTGAQKVRVASTTTNVGAPSLFAVAHTANNQVIGSWSTAGFHSANSNSLAANWRVSTNGTISSANASCAL